MATIRLGEIAYARSGDKGAGANVGVIAHSASGFEILKVYLTAARVETFFSSLNPGIVVRYELPNLLALNFVLPEVLDGGGSVSLRIDTQGKALGQAILELRLDLPEAVYAELLVTQHIDETSPLVISNIEPAIAVLTLNRPQKRNALSLELIEQLCEAVLREAENPARRVIVFRGNGPVFCAGLDLQEASQSGGSAKAAAALARLYTAIISSPLVTIAAAQGAAVAGGVGLLAACDLVVASEELKISLPEVRRGLVPALVSCLLSRQISGRTLRELVLSGLPVDSHRALNIGLVNRVAAKDRLYDVAMDMARGICKAAPGAIASTKKLLNEMDLPPIAELLQQAVAYHQTNDSEAAEGMAAFVEKRPPVWKTRN